jgi:phospholipid/cholesterol/gamma-HCH transport system substrate-binding protein
MKLILRRQWKGLVSMIVLFTIAVVVGGYIVDHQRLRIPFVESKPFELKFALSTAQAVTPGQGQTVRVAGVRVGDIENVELVDGRAVVTAALDDEFRDLVHSDATAFLRPKTGLKDMFIELDPGSHSARVVGKGFTVPVRNTLPDVNPDEFLAGLDRDTRDYLKLLLNGAGRGLDHRAGDLRDVLRRFEPTYRDLARVSSAAAGRRRELSRLINSLNRLNSHLATRDDDLAELIGNASRSFHSLAAEHDNVAATVRELPSTLQQGTSTLTRVERMARILGPASVHIRPAIRSLRAANRAVLPLAREAAPLLRSDIRPFVRDARPFMRALRPAARDLVTAEPTLKRTIGALNHLFNLIGYNPRGAEGPDVAGRDEGYLFYLSWLGQQTTNLFRVSDAHGTGRPLTLGGTCGTLRGVLQNEPQLEFLLGLSGVLTDPRVCGGAVG